MGKKFTIQQDISIMVFRKFCLVSIVLGSLGIPRGAGAESVTYNFSGTLDAVDATGNSTVPDGVWLGEAFSGSVTVQLATALNSGTYASYQGNTIDLRFTIGSTTISRMSVESYPRTTLDNYVIVANDDLVYDNVRADQFVAFIRSDQSSDLTHLVERNLTLNLADFEQVPTALASTAVPSGPLDLSTFITTHTIQFSDIDYNFVTGEYDHELFIRGNLESIQLVPATVPAPPAALMLGLGLSAAASWRRVSRRKG